MHPNGIGVATPKQTQFSNINDLLEAAVDSPRSVLEITNLGIQLDLFAKCGQAREVYNVLHALGRQCPQELANSDFLDHILCTLRNGPMFNLCFGNMGNVQSSAQFIDSCKISSPRLPIH